MTIGTRIAQKRKERGLSQEALGEQLGVSRQAIYKWESDAALPEIEKLIALSRLFGVSVGWLLGVEDTEQATATSDSDPGESSGELTETQLKMVEEIVARYLAAQPQPQPKKRRLLFKICIAAAGICLAVGMYNMVNRLDQLNTQYNNLQHSVSNISSNVNSQINGISSRVEEILKAQNHLAADYGTELTATDIPRSTVTFSARAVPKTYEEGMSAVFLADSGDGPAEFPAELSPGRAFTGEITTELTDLITISVVFISPDGIRQTQLLDTYEDLYRYTIPADQFNIGGSMTFMDVVNGTVTFADNDRYLSISFYNTPNSSIWNPYGITAAKSVSFRVGLFRDRTLLTWLEPCAKPSTFHGFDKHKFFRLPENYSVTISDDETLGFVLFASDEYGREFAISETVYCIDTRDNELTPAARPWEYITSPEEWIF